MTLTNPITYEGDIPEIGCALGAKFEKFNKKSPSYEVFLDKVSNYVVSNLKYSGDVVSIFRDKKDPMPVFTTKIKLTPLSDADAKIKMEVKIHDKEIDLYVVIKTHLLGNMER